MSYIAVSISRGRCLWKSGLVRPVQEAAACSLRHGALCCTPPDTVPLNLSTLLLPVLVLLATQESFWEEARSELHQMHSSIHPHPEIALFTVNQVLWCCNGLRRRLPAFLVLRKENLRSPTSVLTAHGSTSRPLCRRRKGIYQRTGFHCVHSARGFFAVINVLCALFEGVRIKHKLNYRQHLRAYNPVAPGLLGRTRTPFLAVIRENASLSYESNIYVHSDGYLQYELFENEAGKMGLVVPVPHRPSPDSGVHLIDQHILIIDFWLHGF